MTRSSWSRSSARTVAATSLPEPNNAPTPRCPSVRKSAREIARLEAQAANAQRRQVILAEMKTLGEQLKVARGEVETNKKMSNPALAQIRSTNDLVHASTANQPTEQTGGAVSPSCCT